MRVVVYCRRCSAAGKKNQCSEKKMYIVSGCVRKNTILSKTVNNICITINKTAQGGDSQQDQPEIRRENKSAGAAAAKQYIPHNDLPIAQLKQAARAEACGEHPAVQTTKIREAGF